MCFQENRDTPTESEGPFKTENVQNHGHHTFGLHTSPNQMIRTLKTAKWGRIHRHAPNLTHGFFGHLLDAFFRSRGASPAARADAQCCCRLEAVTPAIFHLRSVVSKLLARKELDRKGAGRRELGPGILVGAFRSPVSGRQSQQSLASKISCLLGRGKQGLTQSNPSATKSVVCLFKRLRG